MKLGDAFTNSSLSSCCNSIVAAGSERFILPAYGFSEPSVGRPSRRRLWILWPDAVVVALVSLLVFGRFVLASVSLVLQLFFPALWWAIVDVREWSRLTWFLVNLAVLVVLVAIRVVPEPRQARAERQAEVAKRKQRGERKRQAAERQEQTAYQDGLPDGRLTRRLTRRATFLGSMASMVKRGDMDSVGAFLLDGDVHQNGDQGGG